MELRRIRNEEDARTCLAAAAESDLLRRDWARANGVDPRSLARWHSNLTDDDDDIGEDSPLRLVELHAPASRGSKYAIYTGEYRVVVGDGFDAQALRRILAVLRPC